MKNVGIVYDEIYSRHDTGNHPECADRVTFTINQFKEYQLYGPDALSHFKAIDPRKATLDQIRWGHKGDLITRVETAVEGTKILYDRRDYLDGDTVVSPASYDAALYATGGNFAAIDAIFRGEIDRAFVLCRPPGHHSNFNACRGFCIFNNVVLAAQYLIREKGMKRIAIVDFDAHAGNGTEDMIESGLEGGDLLFFSMHQHPRTLYPGTCYIEDIGREKQKGKIVNLTFAPYSGQQCVELGFKQIILPMLEEFKPDFILISAGFDAHHEDPLTALGFQDSTYAWMIQQLAAFSEKTAQGRISCTLEGGYNLQAIANSISNVVSTLADDKVLFKEDFYGEEDTVIEFTEQKLLPDLSKILAPYWSCLKE